MQKIPTIFQRNVERPNRITHTPTPACAWVFAGEGRPTQKLDGTACLVSADHRLFRRYVWRLGKPAPAGFVAADTVDHDTGQQPGWVPVGAGPEDQWHREAWERYIRNAIHVRVPEGTYELVGPKIQGNPQEYEQHILAPHATLYIEDVSPRTYETIFAFLLEHAGFEGIVYHHTDGQRMAKIKRKDFGLPWPVHGRGVVRLDDAGEA